MSLFPVSHRPRNSSHLLAMVAIAALAFSAVPSSASAEVVYDDVIHVVQPGEYEILIELREEGADWFQASRATVTNLSGANQTFGFGANAWDENVVEHLWEQSTFEDLAKVELLPGETTVQNFPDWPGVDFHFYRDIFGSVEEIAVAPSDAQHVPVSFMLDDTAQNLDWQIGRTVTTSVDPARAGEAIVVRASGLTAAEVGVYFIPEADLVNELQTLGSIDEFLELDPSQGSFSQFLGTAPVVAGEVAALVTIPSGTAPGAYAVLFDSGSAGLWQAGPPLRIVDSEVLARNLLIEAGQPRTTTVVGDDVVVVPVDPATNESIFEFTFDAVTSAGETTVRTTNTLPDGVSQPTFSVLTDPPVYYLLETTAAFDGQLNLCVTVTGLSAGTFATVGFFHHAGGAWEQIGADWSYDETTGVGVICGSTTSLSPFALGFLPEPWPFSGFQDPVDDDQLNLMKAGSAVPVKFSLVGDRGLEIFEAGSPASARVTCGTLSADPVEATTTAGKSGLQYDAASDTYSYIWKTDKAWAGTCRQLTLALADGSIHQVAFQFR